MASVIAKRYAVALYRLAEELKKAQAVAQDIEQLAGLIKDSEEFKRFVANPIIPSLKRAGVLKRLFENSLEEVTSRFLVFLEYKKRFPLLPDVCISFQEYYLQAHNIARVIVMSCQELSQHQMKDLEARFKHRFKQDVILEQKLDPRLIGGIKFQYGDTIYDYTLRKHLDRYKEAVLT